MAESLPASGETQNVEERQMHERILANPQSAAALQFAVNQYIKCIGAALNSTAGKSSMEHQGKTYIPIALAYSIARNRVYKGLLKQPHPKDTADK